MKVPVQICRKDDAGKEVVVETVDGPVVAYLASVKELEGEGAGENKKKRLNKKDKKKQEKEKKEKKEKEKQEKKKENEKDKGKDKQGNKQGNNKKKDVQTEAATAAATAAATTAPTPAPGPSPLDSFARVPMFPEGVVPQVYDSLTAAIQTLSPTFMPSNESNLQRLELQQRLDRMLQEDLSTEAQGVTLAVFGRYVFFFVAQCFFGLLTLCFSLFFVLCSLFFVLFLFFVPFLFFPVFCPPPSLPPC